MDDYGISLEEGAFEIQGHGPAATMLYEDLQGDFTSLTSFLPCHEEVGVRMRSHKLVSCGPAEIWSAEISLWLTGHML